MSDRAATGAMSDRAATGAMSDRAATGTIYRIVWSPGSDRLHGVCHCGAEHVADDPVQMWEWLLAHPDHDAAAGRDPW